MNYSLFVKGTDTEKKDVNKVEGLNDKQLARIARNTQFINTYNHIISSTSSLGQSQQEWKFETINRLKKDALEFNKRLIRDHLES